MTLKGIFLPLVNNLSQAAKCRACNCRFWCNCDTSW